MHEFSKRLIFNEKIKLRKCIIFLGNLGMGELISKKGATTLEYDIRHLFPYCLCYDIAFLSKGIL